jgi:hypothetical protein
MLLLENEVNDAENIRRRSAQPQGSTAKRTSFNNRYGTTLRATGSPNATGRTKLFTITGTTGYNETTVWRSL